ncbi:hypothetical protein [Mycetocola lacteus]|uniref:hypothetical protein n=1 Tax=Mycetocola lacteus TaxID=76637 RepID=UPI0011C42B45|nr:hypothetical protein [Mycetocola lacteus]
MSGVVSIGLAMMITLTGCLSNPYPEIPRFAKSGGQTQAELDTKLTTIPGMVVKRAAGSKPNVKGNVGYRYEVEIDPQFRVNDPVGLVDFLVKSAWSVRDGYMPNSDISIGVTGLPEDDLDYVAVAEQAGWVPPGTQTHRGVAENGYSGVQVWVGTQSPSSERWGGPVNRERLGKWPGDAPDVPENLVVPR